MRFARKSTLIQKKNRLRAIAAKVFKTIIAKPFFVSQKSVNAFTIINFVDTQSNFNFVNKLSTKKNSNKKKVKIEIISFKAKELKFEKMKFYKSKFENKHIYWFQNATFQIIRNFSYFRIDKNKIVYCITFLKNDSKI